LTGEGNNLMIILL